MRRHAALAFAALLAGCAFSDSRVAERAQTQLLGMRQVDLESCLGVPDHAASFGRTDVLTYAFSSAATSSFSLPLVGGPGFANGGNCRMTVRLDDGLVSRVLYSGEKNATGAPDAYCAPLVRTCLAFLDRQRLPDARTGDDARAGSP